MAVSMLKLDGLEKKKMKVCNENCVLITANFHECTVSCIVSNKIKSLFSYK